MKQQTHFLIGPFHCKLLDSCMFCLQGQAHLMCSLVFTTVCAMVLSLDCHSYLHCKYGKHCSGRDLKITPLRATVTKLIDGGVGAEQVSTMQVSLPFPFISSLSSHPCHPISLSLPLSAVA